MKRPSLLRQDLEAYERKYLLAALELHKWNRAQTARDLGISYRTICYKIERLHLSPPPSEFAESA
jgi:DNA-binding NtrC family response regulator